MRTVNISKLKKQLRKYLALAKAGEEIIICSRNLPVAKLVPFNSEGASEEELRLVAAGMMRLPKKPVDLDKLLPVPTGRVTGNEAVEALIKEREEGL